MVLLGWLYMADILENPYGFNKKYDTNLDEVNNAIRLGAKKIWITLWQIPGASVEHLALLCDDPTSEREQGWQQGGEEEDSDEDLGADQARPGHLLKSHRNNYACV